MLYIIPVAVKLLTYYYITQSPKRGFVTIVCHNITIVGNNLPLVSSLSLLCLSNRSPLIYSPVFIFSEPLL